MSLRTAPLTRTPIETSSHANVLHVPLKRRQLTANRQSGWPDLPSEEGYEKGEIVPNFEGCTVCQARGGGETYLESEDWNGIKNWWYRQTDSTAIQIEATGGGGGLVEKPSG